MLFLAILIASTAIAWLTRRRRGGWRDHARAGLALALAFAGISHFTRAEPFVQHMPDWAPGREAIVYATGVIEVALGALLLFARGRGRAVGRLVACYLVAVLPANLYVAVADVDVSGQPGGIHAWIRLPLQAVFVAWALASTRPGPGIERDRQAQPDGAPRWIASMR